MRWGARRRWPNPLPRWVGVLIAALLVILFLWTSLRLVGLSRALARSLETLTGREVTIRGSTQVRLGLRPGLQVEEVDIEPAPGSTLGHLHADRLAVTFAWRSLLRGDFGPRELQLEGVKIVVELPGVSTSAKAERTRPTPARSLTLRRIQAKNLTIELRSGTRDKPIAAELRSLSLETGTGSFLDFSAAGSLEEIRFDVSGQIARPESGAESLPVHFEGRIAQAEIGGRGKFRLRGEGPTLALDVDGRAEHLEDVGVASAGGEQEISQLGPLRVSAHLTASRGSVGISDLTLQLGDRQSAWLDLEGNVGDLNQRRDYRLHADFGFNDVRVLRPWVGDAPPVGRVVGKAILRDVKGRSGIEEFSLRGGQPGIFEIDAEGYIEDIRRVEGLNARVDLKARDLAVVGALVRLPLPLLGPVEVSAHVQGDAGKFDSQHIHIRLGKTHVSGAVSGFFPAQDRPRLSATLDVPVLHLEDFDRQPRSDREPPRAPSPSPEPLFADRGIDFAALQEVDGKLAARVEHVTGTAGPLLERVQLDAALAAGELNLKHLAFTLKGGRIAGEVVLNARATPATVTARAEAKSVELGALVAQLGHRETYSGDVDARLDLSSQGDSLHAWASGVTGDVEVVGENASIEIPHTGVLTRDLLHFVQRELPGFLGGGKASQTAKVNCVIAHLIFRDGVAEPQPLLLDTERSTVIGQGSIDLGAEHIDLRLIPTRHPSGLVSVTPTVRIVGSLQSPDVKTEKISLATSAARSLVDSATRLSGAKAAMRALGLTAGKNSPCSEALASR